MGHCTVLVAIQYIQTNHIELQMLFSLSIFSKAYLVVATC